MNKECLHLKKLVTWISLALHVCIAYFFLIRYNAFCVNRHVLQDTDKKFQVLRWQAQRNCPK